MKIARTLGALAAAGLLAASAAVPANAAPHTGATKDKAPISTSDPTIDPRIVGGNDVPLSAAPYATQVYINGQFACSASIIGAQWVLTAKHCGGSNMSVKVGSASLGQGTTLSVTQTYAWSGGDILLLKLNGSFQTTYGTLAASKVSVGSVGNIYGWGRETYDGPASPTLKTAQVKYNRDSTDAYGGPAYQHNGIDGQAWKGDSGGPFVVGGKIVGVASTSASYGRDINAISNYTRVDAAASWITSVTGIQAR